MPSEELLSEINSAVEEVAEANSKENDSDDGNPEEFEVATLQDGGRAGDSPEVDEGGLDGGEEVSEEPGASGVEDEQDNDGGSEVEDDELPEQEGEYNPFEDVDLATAAIRAGMSIEDLNGFKSRGALERVVEIISASGEPDEEEQEDDPLLGIPDLDPEENSEEAIKAFAALKEVAREQRQKIEELASGHREMNDAQYESAKRELVSEFDGFVADLGEDFAEHLGKGATHTLTPGSTGHVNRDRVMEQMAVLIHGYNASGIQRPTRKELFSMAVGNVLPDAIISSRAKAASAKLSEQEDSHLARPSGKNRKKSGDPLQEVADEIDRKFGFK